MIPAIDDSGGVVDEAGGFDESGGFVDGVVDESVGFMIFRRDSLIIPARVC